MYYYVLLFVIVSEDRYEIVPCVYAIEVLCKHMYTLHGASIPSCDISDINKCL